MALVGQPLEQAVWMSPSFTGLPSFLAAILPAWMRCTHMLHFSITPRERTVTSGFSTMRPTSSHAGFTSPNFSVT